MGLMTEQRHNHTLPAWQPRVEFVVQGTRHNSILGPLKNQDFGGDVFQNGPQVEPSEQVQTMRHGRYRREGIFLAIDRPAVKDHAGKLAFAVVGKDGFTKRQVRERSWHQSAKSKGQPFGSTEAPEGESPLNRGFGEPTRLAS